MFKESGMGVPDHRFNIRLGAALILFLLILGCATAKEINKTYDNSRIIKNIPFYPQEEYQCGPSSLSGVLNYWGVAAAPEEIAKDIYSRSARGTLNIDMIFYVRKKGLAVSQYSGSLEDLKEKIDSGYPLIVLVDYGAFFYQVNHFMVVIGYSENGVIVNSREEEKKFIPMDDFLGLWEKTKFWTLLIKRQ